MDRGWGVKNSGRMACPRCQGEFSKRREGRPWTGGGKEGREGRRGEVSKLRGVVCSPLPPRPSPRDFLFLGDGHGDEQKKELRIAHRGGSIRALPTISAEKSTGQLTRSSSVNSPAATPPSTIAAVRRPLAFPPTPRVVGGSSRSCAVASLRTSRDIVASGLQF